MTRIEAELRELDRHGDDDDDDDIAMAVVAAAAASALASGQELPASQKALLEAQKMKQMQQHTVRINTNGGHFGGNERIAMTRLGAARRAARGPGARRGLRIGRF